MIKERDWNIDFLRILACIMVIFIHVSAQNWRTISVNTSEWKVFFFYDTISQSAVSLFLMISGKLFLAKDSLPPLRQFYKKNIAKLVYLYILWAFFYAIDTVGIKKILAGGAMKDLVLHTLDAKIHLWFLPALISIYFLLPIFWSVVKYEHGKYVLYACGMWILFGIIKPTLLIFPLPENLITLINLFDYAFIGHCGYFLLGHVLDKYQHKLKIIKTPALITGYLCTAGICIIIDLNKSLAANEPVISLYGDFKFPVFLEACIIFLLFMRIPDLHLSDRTYNIIQKISKYTLFVYLSHIFVLQHLKTNLGISTLSFHPILSVPILTAATFIICIFTAYVIDHIPFIRKWIM